MWKEFPSKFWIFLLILLTYQELSHGSMRGDRKMAMYAINSERLVNRTVKIGSDILISCNSTQNNVVFVTWYFIKSFLGQELQIATCSKTECVYQGKETLKNLKPSFNEITISSLSRENTGQYMCKEFNSEGKSQQSFANIIIGSNPGKPTISLENKEILKNRQHSDFEVGDEIVLSCETSEGYPNPTFRWASDKLDNIPADQVVHPTDFYGKSKSKLHLKMRAEDNYSSIKCYVTNSLMIDSQELDAVYNINVRYAPKISFPQNIRNWVVISGQATRIECNADGYPKAEVSWLDEYNQQASTNSLLVLNETLPAEGLTKHKLIKHYKCLANSSEGVAEEEIQVKIAYGPIVSVKRETEVNEGESLVEIFCTVRSEPMPKRVFWRRVDQTSNEVWHSPALQINNVTREMAGLYECEAENEIRPTGDMPRTFKAKSEMNLVVNYKPEKPKIYMNQLSGLKVGQLIDIQCQANTKSPGLPMPKFRLFRSPPGLHTGNVIVQTFFANQSPINELWEEIQNFDGIFRIENSTLSDSGVYFCMVSNPLGQSYSDPINVQVLQPLQWRIVPRNEKIDLSQVSAGRELYFECSVEGSQLPNLIWSRNNQQLIAFDFEKELFKQKNRDDKFIFTNENRSVRNHVELSLITTPAGESLRKGLVWRMTSILNWPKAGIQPGDESQFSCITQDKETHKMLLKHDFNIDLLYALKLFPGHETVQGYDTENRKANLTCLFLSPTRPANAEFFKDNKLITSKANDVVLSRVSFYGNDVWQVGMMVDTSFYNLDKTTFHCSARNGHGSDRGDIRLVEFGSPEKIVNFKVENIDWECCDLYWNKNFNGGSPQRFTVVYQTSKSHKPIHRNISDGDIEFQPETKRFKTRFCDLYADETYTMMIFASNTFGKSLSSNYVDFKTTKPNLPTHVIYQYMKGNEELKVFPPTKSSNHCVLVEYSTNQGQDWDKIQRICSTEVDRLRLDANLRTAREILLDEAFKVNFPNPKKFEGEMQQDDYPNSNGVKVMNNLDAKTNDFQRNNNYVIIKNPTEKKRHIYRLRNCLFQRPEICNQAYIINLEDSAAFNVSKTLTATLILISTFCLLIFFVITLILVIKVRSRKSQRNENIRLKNLPKHFTQCISKDYPSLLNQTDSVLPNQTPSSPTSSSRLGLSYRGENTSTMNTHTSSMNQRMPTDGISQNYRSYLNDSNSINGQLLMSTMSVQNQNAGSNSTVSLLPLGPQMMSTESNSLWKIQDHLYIEQQNNPSPHSQQHHHHNQQPSCGVYSSSQNAIFTKEPAFIYPGSPSMSCDSGHNSTKNNTMPTSSVTTSSFTQKNLDSQGQQQSLQVYFPVSQTGNMDGAYVTTLQLSNDIPVELITLANPTDSQNLYFHHEIPPNYKNDSFETEAPVNNYVIPRSYCRL